MSLTHIDVGARLDRKRPGSDPLLDLIDRNGNRNRNAQAWAGKSRPKNTGQTERVRIPTARSKLIACMTSPQEEHVLSSSVKRLQTFGDLK